MDKPQEDWTERFDCAFCDIINNKKWWSDRMCTPDKVKSFIKSELDAQKEKLLLDKWEVEKIIRNYYPEFQGEFGKENKKQMLESITNLQNDQ